MSSYLRLHLVWTLAYAAVCIGNLISTNDISFFFIFINIFRESDISRNKLLNLINPFKIFFFQIGMLMNYLYYKLFQELNLF